MFNSKRLYIAVALGFVMGLGCWVSAVILHDVKFTQAEIVNIFVNRMLMGFVIGISILKMSWYSHGLLIGFIVGLPFLMYDYMSGKEMAVVIGVAVVNPLYGLAIEFFTTKVFKQGVE